MDLRFIAPPLFEVNAFFVVIETAAFQKGLWETVQAFLAWRAFAVAIGIPTGTLMGVNRLVDKLLLP